MTSAVKRRSAWGGLLLLIACCLAPVAVFGEEKIEILFFAAAYTPGVTTGDNPQPLREFERIAREWEALNPGVTVTFVEQPIGDYLTWMLTQMKGGMGPDMMWAEGGWCNDYARNGWFVDLNPYLSEPNPHVPGNERWEDLFYEYYLDSKRAADGSLYSLPIDLNETGIYYNKDIFAEVGVEPPRTWADLMEVCRLIDEAGYVPFTLAAREYGPLAWIAWALHDQLWHDVTPLIDVQGRTPGVDDQEAIRAYKLGLWSVRDPRYEEMLRILKEWSRYWNRDAMATTPESERLFRTGKAAMVYNGSWYMPQLERDPLRTFGFGVFPVPPITRETSPYAPEYTGPAPGVGGAGATQYTITHNARRRGKLELCVDFMRFFTAPRNIGPLVNEARMSVPNLPDVDVHPMMDPFLPVLQGRSVAFQGSLRADKQHYAHEFRVFQSYLGGQYSLDEAVESVAVSLDKAVERVLEENPQWRFGDDWSILPSTQVEGTEANVSSGTLTALFPYVFPLAVLGAMAAGMIGGSRFRRNRMRRLAGIYAFLLPTMLLLAWFSYFPIFSAFYHAFCTWEASGASTWVGLGNFSRLLSDRVLSESVLNLAKLLGFGLAVSVTVPLVVAEVIFHLKSKRAQYFYRVVFVVPMIVPSIVMMLIWGFIYDYNVGVLNQLLRSLGLGEWTRAWLADPRIALYSLMFIGFPWVHGFGLLLYTAGLQSIPQSVLDSSRLDGATGLLRVWHIDLPLLMSQVKILVVLGVIGGIQGFQLQLLLTQGGPGYSTMVPGLVLYNNSMLFDRMGYACAIGVVLFLVTLGMTYINMRYLKSSTEYETG